MLSSFVMKMAEFRAVSRSRIIALSVRCITVDRLRVRPAIATVLDLVLPLSPTMVDDSYRLNNPEGARHRPD